jgi:peptidoglycan/LPS O-acetylase OafA/YrhL
MKVATLTPSSAIDAGHLRALDGWRGISILCVLAAHLFPLGPKAWQLNDMVAPMGMALFFTLSGFLITRFLLEHDSVLDFLIRRFFRIVPLAWVAMVIVLVMAVAPPSAYLPNFLFYANLPPQSLVDAGSHLWSLCVEVQFYAGIALVVGMFGRRGLYLLPVVCIAVTLHRVSAHAYIDIVTWRRVDEILAGGVLAMVFADRFGARPRRLLRWLNPYALLLLLALACHPAAGFMNYLRPYFAALLVGATLFGPPVRLDALLGSRVLRYVANVSFALYVIHHPLVHTWLGSGDTLVRYLKRPLLLAATFGLAHVSTFYFEQRCIAFGKRLSTRMTGGRLERNVP